MRTPDDYQQLIADRCVEHAEKLGRSIDYIETGVCTGNSAEAVLSTGKVRFAVLIDTFPSDYCGHSISAEQVEQRLEQYEDLFSVRQGDSREILPTVVEEFDIGFVDGDHSENGCRSDMANMLRRLRKDGVMFVDDLGPNGSNLQDCVERFALDHNLNMKYHEVHNGLAELTRK